MKLFVRLTRTDFVGTASFVCLRLHSRRWKGKKDATLEVLGAPCEKTAVLFTFGRKMAVVSVSQIFLLKPVVVEFWGKHYSGWKKPLNGSPEKGSGG